MNRRTRTILAVLAALLAVTCSIEVKFHPDHDDQAMGRLEQLFSQGGEGGLQLTLCEDRVRADQAEEGACGVDHIVKGGGRGSYSSALRGGNDCSGCPDQAVAYVQGVLRGGDFGDAAGVQGVVIFDDYDDPYRLPYQLALRCIDEENPCDIDGQLMGSGFLNLTVTREGFVVVNSLSLMAQGQNECAGD